MARLARFTKSGMSQAFLGPCFRPRRECARTRTLRVRRHCNALAMRNAMRCAALAVNEHTHTGDDRGNTPCDRFSKFSARRIYYRHVNVVMCCGPFEFQFLTFCIRCLNVTGQPKSSHHTHSLAQPKVCCDRQFITSVNCMKLHSFCVCLASELLWQQRLLRRAGRIDLFGCRSSTIARA